MAAPRHLLETGRATAESQATLTVKAGTAMDAADTVELAAAAAEPLQMPGINPCPARAETATTRPAEKGTEAYMAFLGEPAEDIMARTA